jgi:hypothetical protein
MTRIDKLENSVLIHPDTDAGFDFGTDTVRGEFTLRNQAQGTRRWMVQHDIRTGDRITITRIDRMTCQLRRWRTG